MTIYDMNSCKNGLYNDQQHISTCFYFVIKFPSHVVKTICTMQSRAALDFDRRRSPCICHGVLQKSDNVFADCGEQAVILNVARHD